MNIENNAKEETQFKSSTQTPTRILNKTNAKIYKCLSIKIHQKNEREIINYK